MSFLQAWRSLEGGYVRFLALLLLLAIGLTSAGCELVGDIFQAGFWVGTIVVVILLVGIFMLVGRARRS